MRNLCNGKYTTTYNFFHFIYYYKITVQYSNVKDLTFICINHYERISYVHNLFFLLFTEALQQGASQFEQQAGKLKRKFWWKNCKVISIIAMNACLKCIIEIQYV